MNYKQVEGRSDLFRDTENGAIVIQINPHILPIKQKRIKD